MPIVRFDPPKRPKVGLLDQVRTVVGLYTAPVETMLGFATNRGNNRGDPIYMTAPVEVNTDTGRVAVELTDQFKGKGKNAIIDTVRNNAREQVQKALQTVYDTGVATLPKGYGAYDAVAQQLAALTGQYNQVAYYNWPKEAAPVDREEAPEQDSPAPFIQYDEGNTMAGGFLPPGGLAGFSQMMGVSKLALTGRRSASTGRRKRRKTKAAKPRKRRASAKRGKKRLVKGSAAAKRYMASIRKKRRG